MTDAARRPRPGPGRAMEGARGGGAAGCAPPPAPRSGPDADGVADTAVGGVVRVGGETIRVAGLAAGLRRHPRLQRQAAVGAILAGVALFVVSGVTSFAGADVAARRHTPAPAPTGSSWPPPAAPAPLPATAPLALSSAPVLVAKPAPVNSSVISGLAADGIPEVALNAYRVAAARLASVQPACGIDWALLAGIGREESDHGQFGGAVLHADGLSTPPIIGPALDGVHWDYVPAPADGLALDGDATYAHALGPMQFIPSTWAIYGTSASGHGEPDIFNINDAALSAARYLCAVGGDLRTVAGQTRAVLAYNHSDQYLAQVLALADAYRRGISIAGLPVGVTSGPLPGIHDTGTIPPANPGAPTAGKPTRPTPTPAPGRGGTPSHSGAPARSGSPSHGGSTPPPSHGGSPSRSGSPPPGSGTPSSGSTPTPSPSKSCPTWLHDLHLC